MRRFRRSGLPRELRVLKAKSFSRDTHSCLRFQSCRGAEHCEGILASLVRVLIGMNGRVWTSKVNYTYSPEQLLVLVGKLHKQLLGSLAAVRLPFHKMLPFATLFAYFVRRRWDSARCFTQVQCNSFWAGGRTHTYTHARADAQSALSA